jgi:hypothetical protein
MTNNNHPVSNESVHATLTVPMCLQRHPAVGRTRLYLAMKAGTLRSIRVGKRLAITPQDLDIWVASGCPISDET